MRMLLTSSGVLDGPQNDALLDLLAKPIAECRTVVVLDAILPFAGDKSGMLEHLRKYRALGWAECDILTLFSGPASGIETRLRNADVIFCYGGTNHWLAHAWVASGLAPVLRELLDEKVYVGVSAGSMIFSRLHAAAVGALDDQDEVEMLQLESVGPALPLFDWFFVAHLGAPFFPHATDQWAADVAGRMGGETWFLEDGSGLLVRDPGAEPQVVSDGHWLHFDADGVLVSSG
jgi:dipeptidase E